MRLTRLRELELEIKVLEDLIVTSKSRDSYKTRVQLYLNSFREYIWWRT